MVSLILVASIILLSTDVSAEPSTPTPEVEERADETEGQHCLGQSESRWFYNQFFIFRYNALGVEHLGSVGICAPLIRRPGMFFDLTNFSLGTSYALAPAYVHFGGFVQIAPLSILVLKAEFQGIRVWNFPMNRVGYFEADDYEAPINPDNYPSEQGDHAIGWYAGFSALLRARIDIGPIGLIVLNSLAVEIWRVGDGDYYPNLRHDIIMARIDTIIANEAMLMAEVPVRSLNIRFGAYDSMRYVPAAGALDNNVGMVAMLNWPRNGRWVRGLTPFVRVGWYTHRPEMRPGRTVAYLGLIFDIDLGSAGGG